MLLDVLAIFSRQAYELRFWRVDTSSIVIIYCGFGQRENELSTGTEWSLNEITFRTQKCVTLLNMSESFVVQYFDAS
jgi:hypothetical protein